MNKSSSIRQRLEEYGFTQVCSSNCFIAYTDMYCFEIYFEKVGYGSRWNIDCSIYMLNEKGFAIGICPSSNEYIHKVSQFSATLKKWDANKIQWDDKKQKYESKTKRYPDAHSDSMIFVIDNYIMPSFAWKAKYYKIDNVYLSLIKFSNKKNKITNDLKFKDVVNIDTLYEIDSIESLKKLDLLFHYLKKHLYDKIEETKNEIHYYNKEKEIYIIIIFTSSIFLSFEVIPKQYYKHRSTFYSQNEYQVTFFKEDFLNFGWFIGNDEYIKKNLPNAIENLNKYLTNPNLFKKEEKETSFDYKKLNSLSAEEILKKKFNL